MATTRSRAAIVAAARTPIGTARRGTLANVPAIDLAKPVVSAVIERSGLDAAGFDDLVLAESMQGGGDSARYIAVALGLTRNTVKTYLQRAMEKLGAHNRVEALSRASVLGIL